MLTLATMWVTQSGAFASSISCPVGDCIKNTEACAPSIQEQSQYISRGSCEVEIDGEDVEGTCYQNYQPSNPEECILQPNKDQETSDSPEEEQEEGPEEQDPDTQSTDSTQVYVEVREGASQVNHQQGPITVNQSQQVTIWARGQQNLQCSVSILKGGQEITALQNGQGSSTFLCGNVFGADQRNYEAINKTSIELQGNQDVNEAEMQVSAISDGGDGSREASTVIPVEFQNE